jgi:hypothetical protein
VIPWGKLLENMGWDIEQLNDVFGEWALHNITWDYQNPPPAEPSNQGPSYRDGYGPITERRFVSLHSWAPQRRGYNVVRLYPEAGQSSVKVTFRGVLQPEADAGFRSERWRLCHPERAGLRVRGTVRARAGWQRDRHRAHRRSCRDFAGRDRVRRRRGRAPCALALHGERLGAGADHVLSARYVDAATQSRVIADVTPPPPYAWRP